MTNSTPLWPQAHLSVKMCLTPHCGKDFCCSDLDKWYAAVATSTFVSQNVQNTSAPDHFLKLRCQKMARRCGEKRICQSKCAKHIGTDHFLKLRCQKIARCGEKRICQSKRTKHVSAGPLFEAPMPKNGTPQWREAHLQVKMC